MNSSKYDLLPYQYLVVVTNITVLISNALLEEAEKSKTTSGEITSWVKKQAPKFDEWRDRLLETELRTIQNLKDEQKAQWIVGTFEGIKFIMSEAESVSKEITMKDVNKQFFDLLMDSLSTLYKHYEQAQRYLR